MTTSQMIADFTTFAIQAVVGWNGSLISSEPFIINDW